MSSTYTPTRGDKVIVQCQHAWLAAEKGLIFPVSGTVRMTTEKAILLIPSGKNDQQGVWLPLAKIDVEPDNTPPAGLVAKTRTDLSYPPTKTEPWLHQKQAVFFMEGRDWGLYGIEMGGGKTKPTIDLLLSRGYQSILILCPKNVVNVWPKQFRLHGATPVHIYAADTGSVQARTARAQQELSYAKANGVPCVIIINYEAAIHEPFQQWASEYRWDAVIADEGHRIKQASGKISKAVWAFGRYRPKRFIMQNGAKRAVYVVVREAKLRMLLTGTPMPHGPCDVFAQFRFLDDNVFGMSYPKFEERYAIKGSQLKGIEDMADFNRQFPHAFLTIPLDELRGPQRSKVHGQFADKVVVGYQRQDEFQRILHDGMFRVEVDEVMDLPPFIDDNRYFRLEGEAARIYHELSEEMVAEIQGGLVTASNVLVRLIRLAQITSGYVRDDEHVDHKVSEAKSDLLRDLLEDIPLTEPVVIFCRFRPDLDIARAVSAKLGRRTGELSGTCRDITADSTMPDDLDTLVVQYQSGGVGIDLTSARYTIDYSKDFNGGNYEQARARVRRPGQTRPVTHYHLLAQGTVDEEIQQALNDHADVVQYVMRRAQAMTTAKE